ncbi:hypothetical protein F0562_000771 [Nyssa sinensis]|uniref:Uncharacterized protein n=1 Tax=Nyssa sinensis TaxID=561372 RepID=A0A5J5C5B8_9ASTE|nr:hypothetical protein F0562_000771 [Nyssa sinensis]
MKVQLLFLVGIVALSIAVKKCQQLVGKESSPKSWTESFKISNCFDMKYGTIACIVKEIVKLYLFYIRSVHVQKVREEATEAAEADLKKEISQGQQISSEEASKLAREKGNAAAKRASQQITHITGPLMASGWEIFETLYLKGTLTEGIIRGIGTFVGAYTGGMIGEGNLKWGGFVVGSQLGSWVGGRIGLLAYEIGTGVEHLLRSLLCKNNSNGSQAFKYPFF